MIKTIITIQHPESIHHVNKMVGSWTDWDLTEKGIEQAKNIASNLYLEYQNRNFVIYSSDLKRTKETAIELEKVFNIKAIYKECLRERYLGRACGKSVEWFKNNLDKNEITIDDKCISDGESRHDVYNRLLSFYKEIINNDEENIIIVSHGDTLSIFNLMFLELDVNMLNRIDLYGLAGGVSIFVVKDNKHVIRRLSDKSYMIKK